MSKVILFILFQLSFVFLSFSSAQAQSKFKLVLSEIMFCSEPGNNEFVEIYNTDNTQSINLEGFGIRYNTAKSDLVTDAGYGTILPPESYAVIMEGDYNIPNGLYKDIIPPSALILKISDNSFGSSGMSNSVGRPVKLLNGFGEEIDSCIYSADNPRNISDEKLFLNSAGSADNWKNSLRTYGTPGFRNSVTPYNYDLKIESLSIIPSSEILGQVISIDVTILNTGLNSAGRFTVGLYDDINNDSAASPNEMISEKIYEGMNRGDSVESIINYTPVFTGIRNIIAVINYVDDQYNENNIEYDVLNIYVPEHEYNDAVINEIMYAPFNGEPEWIELFNRSNKKINLKNWTVSDNKTTVFLTEKDVIINPSSYIVISKDSSLSEFYRLKDLVICRSMPSLNNTGDKVVVADSLNMPVDSVIYRSEWGGKNGKSLERIDPGIKSNDSSNWSSSKSLNNGTPGNINSISKKDFDVELTSVYLFPQKPLYGEDVNIFARVKNIGRNSVTFSLDLYEDTDFDSVFEKYVPDGRTFTLRSGDSTECRINFVINKIGSKKLILVKAVSVPDQDTANNSFEILIRPGFNPSTVLINEIMPNPAGGEPEWIELINTSSLNVDMSGWTINDVLTTPYTVKIPRGVILQQNSYLVLTSDSAVSRYHKNIPCRLISINLPLLNNDEDGIVLKDDRNVIIDSMFYDKSYRIVKGYSLERRSIFNKSVDPENWALSRDAEQSTPGRINSTAKKHHDLMLKRIYTAPAFPVEGENISIKAEVMDIGESEEQDYSVLFFYKKAFEDNDCTFLSEVKGLRIAPDDSMFISSPNPVREIKDGTVIFCKIASITDEDTTNNKDTIIVQTGYPEGIVKINEIMYDPDKGIPEWFELVNTSKTDTVNFRDWSVSEIMPSQKELILRNINEYLNPEQYMIITGDKSFINIYPECKAKLITLKFGILGNTSDGIVIYDSRGEIIDSVFYNSKWGGGNGRSLERISLSGGSNDSTNWRTSLSITKATPGYQNSVVNLFHYKRNCVIINEIMYEPSNSRSEYVELMNISNKPVDLTGWALGNGENSGEELTGPNLLLKSGEYFVVASDSLLIKNFNFSANSVNNIKVQKKLSLSNSGQALVLKDALKNTIDSLFYFPGWHNKNFTSTKDISLEKINPYLNGNKDSDWSSSVDNKGGTPCRQNSIFTISSNQNNNLSVSPNPFSPDNDGFEDFTLIKYRLRNISANVRIRVFNSQGYLVRTVVNGSPSGREGTVVFNGLDDNNNPLRIGIYIILLEAFNQNSGMLESMKKVVVVARKLN